MSAPPSKDAFIPPIITTTANISDDSRDFVEITAAIDNILHSHAKMHTTAVDDSVTEDTSVDYSTELEYSIADDDASSNSSSSPNNEDSTRRLLRQAHQRLEHQSIYEEVKLLRTQLHQKLEIVNKCNDLEQQLSNANQTIEMYKKKEKSYSEDIAKREMEFMNKLNDMCVMMEVEIVERDDRIAKLQNRLNETESMNW